MKKYIIIVFFLVSGLKAISQPDFKQDSIKVAKINSPDQGEAFPFISSDGLRLYFTSTKEGAGRIFFSERWSIDQDFEISRPLSKNLPDSIYGATFTSDELEIYLFDGMSSYYSNRVSYTDEFLLPTAIKGLSDCYIMPSISPNGRELVAVKRWGCHSNISTNAKDTIRLFIKDKTGTFQSHSFLNYPKGFEPGPGQFSKDGLSFVMNVSKRWYDYNNGWTDTVMLLKYTRRSLISTFSNYEVILSNFSGKRPYQLSFNKDETIMVGVLSSKMWEWISNNLVYYKFNQIPK